MKAIDYIRKYEYALKSDDAKEVITAANEMFDDLNKEMLQLIKKRNAKSRDAIIGAVKEQNQKYNAVIDKLDDNILYRNGFAYVVGNMRPVLRPYLPKLVIPKTA